MISNNMFNQDIKPLLPSLSYPQNIMPIKPIGTSLATAPTVSATTGITGGANNSQGGNLHYNSTPAPISSSSSVSNTPIINNHSNGIQHNNSNQSNLPPLQFYSSKDYYDDILHQPLQLNQINQLPTGQIHQFSINQNHQFHPQIVPQLQPTPQTNHLHINTSYFDPKFEKDDDKFSIDYSSIINYTNSPSLKRKKRTRSGQSPNDINNNSINSIILNDDNKLPCQICGKMFAKPYNLKSHMKSHSSEKPFKCSLCPKTFARSHDKKRHELLHNGEKNFKCEGMLKDGKTKWGCGKRFARSDALSRHFRTETGWLCIKPLMDEAKIMESNDLFGNYTHS